MLRYEYGQYSDIDATRLGTDQSRFVLDHGLRQEPGHHRPAAHQRGRAFLLGHHVRRPGSVFGHVRLPAQDQEVVLLFRHTAGFGAEHLLSFGGLSNIHQDLCLRFILSANEKDPAMPGLFHFIIEATRNLLFGRLFLC